MKLKLIPLVLTGSVALSACVANLQNPFSSKLPEQQQAEPVQPAQAAVVKQVSPEQVKRFEKLILSCNNGNAPPRIMLDAEGNAQLDTAEDVSLDEEAKEWKALLQLKGNVSLLQIGGEGVPLDVVAKEKVRLQEWKPFLQLMKELGFRLIDVSFEGDDGSSGETSVLSYQRDTPLIVLGQSTDKIMFTTYVGYGDAGQSFEIIFPKESFKALKKYGDKTIYDNPDEWGATDDYHRSVNQHEDGTYLSCDAVQAAP